MSKIKNSGPDQHDAGPFGQQNFGTAGVEGVNMPQLAMLRHQRLPKQRVVTIPGYPPEEGDLMDIPGRR